MKLCVSLGTLQVLDWDCWILQTLMDYPDHILSASLLNPSLLTIHSASYVPPENPTEYACWLSWVLSGPDAGPLSAPLFHNVQANPVDSSHPWGVSDLKLSSSLLLYLERWCHHLQHLPLLLGILYTPLLQLHLLIFMSLVPSTKAVFKTGLSQSWGCNSVGRGLASAQGLIPYMLHKMDVSNTYL